jgi:hypothetical protein
MTLYVDGEKPLSASACLEKIEELDQQRRGIEKVDLDHRNGSNECQKQIAAIRKIREKYAAALGRYLGYTTAAINAAAPGPPSPSERSDQGGQ